MTVLLYSWGLAGSLAALYIAVGIVDLLSVERHQKREQRLRTALAARLAGGGDEAEVRSELGRAWINRKPKVLQSFARALTGEGARRLQIDAQQAGVTDRIRRMAVRRSWRARTQAAQLLRLLPSTDPVIPALLTDRRQEVRARALDGVDAESLAAHAEIVIAACDATDPATRFAAQQAIIGGDDRIVGALISAVERAAAGSFSPAGTRTVLAAAAGVLDIGVVDAVASHSWGGDVEQRLYVVAALASGLGDNAESRLITMAADDEPAVRAAAINAIGRLGEPRHAATIGRFLRDASWDVRRSAGIALVQLGPAGLLVLRSYSHDTDRFARDMANEMLDRRALDRRWAA